MVMSSSGKVVRIGQRLISMWKNDSTPRKYTTFGKANLGDKDWAPVTDANKSQMRFFKVTVEMK